jgi:hypothetical protein
MSKEKRKRNVGDRREEKRKESWWLTIAHSVAWLSLSKLESSDGEAVELDVDEVSLSE